MPNITNWSELDVRVFSRIATVLSAIQVKSQRSVSLLSQQPGDGFGLIVGLLPRIVAYAGVLGVLDVPTCMFDGFDHHTAAFDRHDPVGIAVKGPDGYLAQLVGVFHAAATTNWHECREGVGMLGAVAPGAVAAHGESCQGNAVPVDVVLGQGLLERQIDVRARALTGFASLSCRASGPATILGTLGHEHHTGEPLGMPAHGLADTHGGLAPAFVAALARAMQEHDEGHSRPGE